MQRRSILLLGVSLALMLGAAVSAPASQIVWSGLVIANNVAQPEPVPPELNRIEETLKELFGYNQFKVIGPPVRPRIVEPHERLSLPID